MKLGGKTSLISGFEPNLNPPAVVGYPAETFPLFDEVIFIDLTHYLLFL